jgi:arylsulfatase A-like enzyme
VSDFVWAFWDFLPTAAELGRGTLPPNLDGISVLPLLLGKTQTNRHEYLYWEFHERGFQQALRMGDWKAIRSQAGEPLELYDLKTDVGEKQDVAEKNPEVVAKMDRLLLEARKPSDRWPIKKPDDKGGGKAKGKAEGNAAANPAN